MFAIAVLLILAVAVLLRPPPPTPVASPREIADQKMQAARAAAKVDDYEATIKLVEEAEALVPGIDRTKLGAQARAELAFTRALDEARKHIAERHFDDARKALERTDKGSGRNEQAKARVIADLDAAEVVYKKEKVDEFIAAGEIEAARRTLTNSRSTSRPTGRRRLKSTRSSSPISAGATRPTSATAPRAPPRSPRPAARTGRRRLHRRRAQVRRRGMGACCLGMQSRRR